MPEVHHAALAGASEARAEDRVGVALQQRGEHAGQVERIVFQIAILDDREFSRGVLDGGADGGALAAVAGVANDLNYAGMQPGQLIQRFRRPIGGTVIHRHDFDGYFLPQRHRQQARDQRRKVFRLVEDRDEDRDFGVGAYQKKMVVRLGGPCGSGAPNRRTRCRPFA